MKLTPKKPSPDLLQAAHDEAVSANRRRKRDKKHESAFLTSPMADSLWRPRYCNDLINFFDRTSWATYKSMKGEEKVIPVDKVPTLARFAIHVGVTVPIVKRWLDLYPAFREAFETAEALRLAFHEENGAAGIAPGFAAAALGLNKTIVAEEKADEPISEVKITVVTGER